MPRPRTPLAKAVATGEARKHRSRYADRREPETAPLGDPPTWFTDEQREAWATFTRELPWLAASDRTLLEIACTLRARLRAGEAGVNALAQLRMCLSAMGATPADRSRITMPEGEEDDAGARYFN